MNKIYSKEKNNYLCISEKFDLSFTFFTHLIDISSYITLYKQFEELKKIIIKNFKPIHSEISKNEEIFENKNNDIKIFNKLSKRNLTYVSNSNINQICKINYKLNNLN